VLVDNARNGWLGLNTDGTFTYTPYPTYAGPDSFTYEASDGMDVSNPATVSIDVINRAPTAVGDPNYVANGTLHGSGLLYNDTDPDNDSLTAEISAGAAHGNVTVESTGDFTYVPDAGYKGP
jgi:titin